jgi:hypothetical protein
MTQRVEMAGRQVGRLRVVAYSRPAPDGVALWCCHCQCGRLCEIRGTSLRKRHTLSCGCAKAEAMANAALRRWSRST